MGLSDGLDSGQLASQAPRVLRWFTGDIGVHHVHHLSPRIPNYRLKRCHDENRVFDSVTVLTVADTLQTFRLALWDEDRERLIAFSEFYADEKA